MKSTIVFASAHSRLNADIMLIRLRRAGINMNGVSAIFSRCFAPNTFFFWLRRPRALRTTVHTDQPFFIAGPIQRLFGRNDDIGDLSRKLSELGVEHRAADHLSDSLATGHALLCVQAKNKDEAAIAWHIFQNSKAGNIAVTTGHPDAKVETIRPSPLMGAWMQAAAA